MPPSSKRGVRAVTGFPRWSVAFAILLTVGMTAALVASYRRCFEMVAHFEEEELALERACGEIRWLDEVLTMSASMAVETGDPAWEERYHDHVTRLDRALATASRLTPGIDAWMGTANTTAANDRLVELELAAFEAVRRSDHDAARALLSGDEYRALKRDYSAGTASVLGMLRTHIGRELQETRDDTTRNALVLTASLPLLLLLWWRVLVALRLNERIRAKDDRRLRAYAARLEDTGEELRRDAHALAYFLAITRHEIRSPMNGVPVSAELLV
jgi:twitching motility protein PilJ